MHCLGSRDFCSGGGRGTGQIITRFVGVLGDMTEVAFESLAHLGTPHPPKKASISDEILRKGLGGMVKCPIPRVVWHELIPTSLPQGLHGVRLPEGKGYPSPETEVMLEVVKGQGVFANFQVQQVEQGGRNCTPFVIPKNSIKALMILDWTPGNAADPEPPPHFILAS